MGNSYHALIEPAEIGYKYLPIPPEIARLFLKEAVSYSGKAPGEEPTRLIVTNECKPFDNLEGKTFQQILSAKVGLNTTELAMALCEEGYGVFLLMPRKDLIVLQGLESSVLV